MTFHGNDAWWWPYVFILIAGWMATDTFRFLGVYFGGKLSETSEILVIIRAVATALVAAVVGNLVFFPSGALADVSPFIRAGAFTAGFAVYLFSGKKVLLGILSAEAVLFAATILIG